jgi:hypothetical protein
MSNSPHPITTKGHFVEAMRTTGSASEATVNETSKYR